MATTGNSYVTYAAKRTNGKWLNKNDPDVKRFLEGGEVPASILAIMNASNKLDSTNVLSEMRFKFPTGDDVEEDDFHIIADPVKHLKAEPLNNHVAPEHRDFARDLLATIIGGFIFYCAFIRGNVPICLADDGQVCVSRAMSILLSILLMVCLLEPTPPQPTTIFMPSKQLRPVLMQYETLKYWKRQCLKTSKSKGS